MNGIQFSNVFGKAAEITLQVTQSKPAAPRKKLMDHLQDNCILVNAHTGNINIHPSLIQNMGVVERISLDFTYAIEGEGQKLIFALGIPYGSSPDGFLGSRSMMQKRVKDENGKISAVSVPLHELLEEGKEFLTKNKEIALYLQKHLAPTEAVFSLRLVPLEDKPSTILVYTPQLKSSVATVRTSEVIERAFALEVIKAIPLGEEDTLEYPQVNEIYLPMEQIAELGNASSEEAVEESAEEISENGPAVEEAIEAIPSEEVEEAPVESDEDVW